MQLIQETLVIIVNPENEIPYIKKIEIINDKIQETKELDFGIKNFDKEL